MKKSAFAELVYSLVAQIPYGKVATYGQIALLIGYPQCPRQVGQALHNVPFFLDLPCHRVVNHAGRPAPHWPAQRQLLEKEGVSFKSDGDVDLKKHIWKTG